MRRNTNRAKAYIRRRQNQRVAKERRRENPGPLSDEARCGRDMFVPSIKARWRITVMDLGMKDSVTVSLYRTPWNWSTKEGHTIEQVLAAIKAMVAATGS